MPTPRPKFEKVDAHTIRIVVERAEDVPLAKLVENRVTLLEQKKAIEQTLKNLDEILEAGKKLGIVAKEKEIKKELCKVCHKNPATRDGECVDCSH